jgi:hypothetical protein
VPREIEKSDSTIRGERQPHWCKWVLIEGLYMRRGDGEARDRIEVRSRSNFSLWARTQEDDCVGRVPLNAGVPFIGTELLGEPVAPFGPTIQLEQESAGPVHIRQFPESVRADDVAAFLVAATFAPPARELMPTVRLATRHNQKSEEVVDLDEMGKPRVVREFEVGAPTFPQFL